jgi:hypothetical protein
MSFDNRLIAARCILAELVTWRGLIRRMRGYGMSACLVECAAPPRARIAELT